MIMREENISRKSVCLFKASLAGDKKGPAKEFFLHRRP